MTIKKPMKAPEPAEAAVPEMPTTGTATIADRFKLDMTDPKAKKSSGGGKSALFAVIAGLIGLAVAGMLTFTLYQHLEFLKGA